MSERTWSSSPFQSFSDAEKFRRVVVLHFACRTFQSTSTRMGEMWCVVIESTTVSESAWERLRADLRQFQAGYQAGLLAGFGEGRR